MYISSDTNIWLDFESLNHLDHPFLLPYKFFISDFTVETELSHSPQISKLVEAKVLGITCLDDKEMAIAMQYTKAYQKLSLYDCIALAIAKSRDWVLLSGDANLRKAATVENVVCHGTIWVYDELLSLNKISKEEYIIYLSELRVAVTSGNRRLPIDELDKRISRLQDLHIPQ